jgi:hypothetical protein
MAVTIQQDNGIRREHSFNPDTTMEPFLIEPLFDECGTEVEGTEKSQRLRAAVKEHFTGLLHQENEDGHFPTLAEYNVLMSAFISGYEACLKANRAKQSVT